MYFNNTCSSTANVPYIVLISMVLYNEKISLKIMKQMCVSNLILFLAIKHIMLSTVIS